MSSIMKQLYSSGLPVFTTRLKYVRFEIFMAVTMKNAIFWNVTPCGFCKNQCFGEMYRLHHQG
jgi:hypothetical protein